MLRASPRSPARLRGLRRPPLVEALALAVMGAVSVAVMGAALGGGAGCGHGQSFDEGVYRKGSLQVRVGPVPAAWRRVTIDGADLAFRDDERGGSALFDVRCGQHDDDAPLSALTQHLIMGTTEREYDTQDTIPFDGREALHTLLRAKLDGVPMQYDIYVMKKDGCIYDLVYVAPPARFAAGSADFERFAAGLQTVSPAQSAEGPSPASGARDP
jgi:hypothetical protein